MLVLLVCKICLVVNHSLRVFAIIYLTEKLLQNYSVFPCPAPDKCALKGTYHKKDKKVNISYLLYLRSLVMSAFLESLTLTKLSCFGFRGKSGTRKETPR